MSTKKISYTRNGKKISYNKRLPIKKVIRSPPCDDDYQEISRKPFKNWKGRTLYCRKKTNIKELRNQITILQSLQKQLESELKKNEEKWKKNNNNNNDKLINKLRENLEELKQEKQNLQNELNDQRNNINAAINLDLTNIKEELKVCNNDKSNINKQLQNIIKEQEQLIKTRDVLRQEVIKLENKIKQDEDKMKKEMKSCVYDKNVLLQKLNIIQGARDKLQKEVNEFKSGISEKNNAQLRSELDQKILLEDSLKEQIRNFNDNCNDKISKLNNQLTDSNAKLNKCQDNFQTFNNRLIKLRDEQKQLKQDLNTCSEKNKLLNEELKKSQLDIVDLKNQINTLNETIKLGKNEREQYETKLNKLEKEKEKIESESVKIKNKYEEQSNKIREISQIQQESEKRYGNINDDNKRDIIKCQENMRNLQINYDKLNKQYELITQQLEKHKDNDVSDRYNSITRERDSLTEQVKELQKNIEQLNKQGKDKDKIISDLEEQLREKDNIIQNLRNNENGLIEESKRYGIEMEDKVEQLQSEIRRLLKKEDVPVSIILNEKEDKIVAVVNEEGKVEALPQEIPTAPVFENIFPVANVPKSERKNLLDDIKKGKHLKPNKSKVERAPNEIVDLLKDIKEKKNVLNKTIECDIGFIWDSKEKKCIPVVKVEERKGLLEEIREGKKLKSTKKCDKGYEWDEKEKKCKKKIVVKTGLEAALSAGLENRRSGIQSEEEESSGSEEDWDTQ